MRPQIAPLVFAVLAAAASAQPAAEQIGTIDFYGYGGLELAKLRALLPFREGDPFPSEEAKQTAEETLAKQTGRAAARITKVCCLKEGRLAVFVGFAEPAAPPLRYNPEPTGEIRLPKEAHRLFSQLERDTRAAVKQGDAGEDDSEGYALMKNPEARGDQLKIRDWVRGNTATTLRVLETSRYRDERADAAEALGYAEPSAEQTAALVRASFDAGEDVRNNAVRALEVLCNLGAEAISRIPAARFVPMLHSLIWADRNKASLLFLMLSKPGASAVLDALRSGALVPLREMAQWRDWSHGAPAAIILARLAGIPDDQVTPAKVPEILAAAR